MHILFVVFIQIGGWLGVSDQIWTLFELRKGHKLMDPPLHVLDLFAMYNLSRCQLCKNWALPVQDVCPVAVAVENPGLQLLQSPAVATALLQVALKVSAAHAVQVVPSP